jgi:hypothetical protein
MKAWKYREGRDGVPGKWTGLETPEIEECPSLPKCPDPEPRLSDSGVCVAGRGCLAYKRLTCHLHLLTTTSGKKQLLQEINHSPFICPS